MFKKIVFPNKLRLYTIPMESVKSVTVLFLFGVGSRYEKKEVNGISHFLEHMFFKGTKKRPSAFEITSLIEGIGGEFNAFTSKEYTGYYVKAASQHLPLIFDVLSDMLTKSIFDPAEIEKERGVILEEINMYEDIPMRRVGEVYDSLLYGDCPMGWSTIGEKETIKKIIRNDFIGQLGTFYKPNNLVIGVAGQLDETRIASLVEGCLGDLKAREVSKYARVCEIQDRPKVSVYHKKSDQAHLCLGVRTFPIDHPDRFAGDLLATILGGGASSRLFMELREKRGLAYYVRTSSDSFQDCGTAVTQAGVDLTKIEEAIKVILEQYRRIKNYESTPLRQGFMGQGIKNEELKKAKEYLKGRLILELEDSQAVASLYVSQELLEKKVRTPEEIMKEIDRVTADDIVRVAKKIFVNSGLNLAVIGPFEDKSRFEKILRI
jgi:predicted Zn-dependent peptidase